MNLQRVCILAALSACATRGSSARPDGSASAAPDSQHRETRATPAQSVEASEVPDSIGPLRLGMTRAEVGSLGLPVRPHPSGQMGDAVRMVGPYYVVFGTDDRVRSVEASLPEHSGGILVGRVEVPPSANLEQAARLFRGCGSLERLSGGNQILCEEGHVSIKVGSVPGAPVQVQVHASGLASQ